MYVLKDEVYSLDLAGCFVQSTKCIMEENAARLAVDIIPISSFPVLLEVICILHNLLPDSRKICGVLGKTK